jgi:hypothetical protein
VLRWRRTTAAFTSFLFFLSYSFTSFWVPVQNLKTALA